MTFYMGVPVKFTGDENARFGCSSKISICCTMEIIELTVRVTYQVLAGFSGHVYLL